MKPEIRLKDLLVVDPTDGSYNYDPLDIIITAYKKRKRDWMISEEDPDDTIEEALTPQQRVRRRQIMRRLKSRIKVGRIRALRRRASNEVLKARAKRAARNELAKRLTGGKSKGELSYSQRARVEKLLAQKKGLIKSLSAKLLGQVRARETARIKNRNKQ
jgi:hypothetical protein